MAKKSKSSQIPKIGTAARKILMDNITGFPVYEDCLDKGRRFFTEDQLVEIEDKYKGGLTWEEIDKVISRQGLVLTQSTFRKYLQEGLLPRATGHNSTSKGSSAVYDSDIIRHINLLLFIFNVPTNDFLNLVIGYLTQNEISAVEAVESKLDRPLYAAISVDLYQSGRETLDAIDVAMTKHPDIAEKAKSMFEEIETAFRDQIDPKITALINLLKDYPMQLTDIPDES